jgi:hypothetical protein
MQNQMKLLLIIHNPFINIFKIVTPTEKKNETKNKLCYENDIRIKVYNKEVNLPDRRSIS